MWNGDIDFHSTFFSYIDLQEYQFINCLMFTRLIICNSRLIIIGATGKINYICIRKKKSINERQTFN